MADALKLHLGCGFTRLEGWVNCDLTPGPTVDRAFDLQKDWPFAESSVDAIYASHVLEHLADPLAFFREAWRVLRPNAAMQLRTPYGDHRAAWWDVTHVRPWYAENFCMFQPGYTDITGNPQHVGWRHPFGVDHVDLRVAGKWSRALRWSLSRRVLLRYGENLQNFVEELWAFMFALKTADDQARYRATHAPAVVGCRYVMYRHHFEGRNALRAGEQPALVSLGAHTVSPAFAEAR